MVKQEVVRININILGISELKWMGRANFIQMTILSEKLLRLGLTDGERELIMGKNAERLLGIRAAN